MNFGPITKKIPRHTTAPTIIRVFPFLKTYLLKKTEIARWCLHWLVFTQTSIMVKTNIFTVLNCSLRSFANTYWYFSRQLNAALLMLTDSREPVPINKKLWLLWLVRTTDKKKRKMNVWSWPLFIVQIGRNITAFSLSAMCCSYNNKSVAGCCKALLWCCCCEDVVFSLLQAGLVLLQILSWDISNSEPAKGKTWVNQHIFYNFTPYNPCLETHFLTWVAFVALFITNSRSNLPKIDKSI